MSDPRYPPPPPYPPSVGMPTTWWTSDNTPTPAPQSAWVEPEPIVVYVQAPEPEPGPGALALMVRHMHIAYNAPTLAAGAILSPAWHQLIQLLGDNWIFAITAVAGAVLLDLVRDRWFTRTLEWMIICGALLDLPVLDQMLRILTGVPL